MHPYDESFNEWFGKYAHPDDEISDYPSTLVRHLWEPFSNCPFNAEACPYQEYQKYCEFVKGATCPLLTLDHFLEWYDYICDQESVEAYDAYLY